MQRLILTSALLQTGTTCEKTSGTNLEMAQRMEQERLAILEHPVVRSISDVDRLKGAQLVLEYVDEVLPLALSQKELF